LPEHWVEVNLSCGVAEQERVLLDVIEPHVKELKKRGELVSWHFFREPEIRFRVRLVGKGEQQEEAAAVKRMAERLRRKGLVSEWHFGNHGVIGEQYVGEEDRYGKRGWKVAQEYFRNGAETALALLKLKMSGKLENPLWEKGLGNPWEGGEKNPWREVELDPLSFHWSRFVHLFSNQLGFDISKEAALSDRQAARYRRVKDEFGMDW
jgi:Lantibiotic biosynthesis dehydratase C-term